VIVGRIAQVLHQRLRASQIGLGFLEIAELDVLADNQAIGIDQPSRGPGLVVLADHSEENLQRFLPISHCHI